MPCKNPTLINDLIAETVIENEKKKKIICWSQIKGENNYIFIKKEECHKNVCYSKDSRGNL